MSKISLKYTTILEYILTVLITKLAFDSLMYFLPVVGSTKNPYIDVLIGMILTIFIFYPVYGLIHKMVEKVSKKIIQTDKRKKISQYTWITVGFVFVFVFIFAGFMKIKRNINVFYELNNFIF
ncbi:MAG: hypothetical protein EAZ27_08940 [Cytophagales bacterium]|nr:MAG: hypothetical protein EAZ27_08940 [Cytophagales bacterium]